MKNTNSCHKESLLNDAFSIDEKEELDYEKSNSNKYVGGQIKEQKTPSAKVYLLFLFAHAILVTLGFYMLSQSFQMKTDFLKKQVISNSQLIKDLYREIGTLKPLLDIYESDDKLLEHSIQRRSVNNTDELLDVTSENGTDHSFLNDDQLLVKPYTENQVNLMSYTNVQLRTFKD